MKVLITGGAGFIGSHLAERYLSSKNEVYVIDDLSTGSINNIQHLINNELFHFIKGNILNYNTMLELVGICDYVFHFAAAVGVKYVLEHPLLSLQVNIKGTDTVLELCNKFKKRVVIASSSEVYGKHLDAPLIESSDIHFGPPSTWRWSYAASKLIDEYTAIAYHRTKKLPVIIVRLFNTVGPRQTGRYGMVIPRFIEQALEDKPITVYGTGEQTRTFTYVNDVVIAVKKLMDCNNALGEIINIGGNEEIQIIQLAHKIKNMVNSKSQIQILPYENVYGKNFEDMMRRVPSTDKLHKMIGYIPQSSLDTILEKTINFYKLSTNKKDG